MNKSIYKAFKFTFSYIEYTCHKICINVIAVDIRIYKLRAANKLEEKVQQILIHSMRW